jgi:hypothetical protein
VHLATVNPHHPLANGVECVTDAAKGKAKEDA